jgi:hypothetical protein
VRELTGWGAARVSQQLEETEVSPTVRPEVLTPETFVRLHRALLDGGWSAR